MSQTTFYICKDTIFLAEYYTSGKISFSQSTE